MRRDLSTNGVRVMRFKLGRKRPTVRIPRLKLKRYLLQTLPTPPLTIDYSPKAQAGLQDILGNDQQGNCTIAAAFHIADVLLANANALPTTDLIAKNAVALYYKLTGGPDTGLDEATVLNYWHSNGLGPSGAHKIFGYVAIDPTNEIELKTALWLFENLYFGLELPDAYVNAMDTMTDGFVWSLQGEPNNNNGHAVMGMAYNELGVTIDSWGILGNFQFGAISYYCSENQGGQVFSVLSSDILARATAKAPNGFSFAQLTADLQVFT